MMSNKRTEKQNFSSSPHGLSHANQWLESAIKKKDIIDNISRFGFKNPGDLKVFLLSPAGQTLKANLNAQLALENAIQKQQQFQRQEEIKKHAFLKINLMLWLIGKQTLAESKSRFDELNAQPVNQTKTSSSANNDKQLQQDFARYDSAIGQFEEEYSRLVTNEETLSNRLSSLEQQQTALETKYEFYNESLASFEQLSAEHESLSSDNLDNLIKSMEDKISTQTEEITELLDSGNLADEENARQLLTEQNALNMQLASLYDLRSAQKGDKVFFNAQGEQVTSQKDAQFVVSKGLKVVEKDGKHYLLKSDQNIDQLSNEEQIKAQSDFKNTHHELMSVKKAVKHTHELEKSFVVTQIAGVKAEQDQNRSEQTELQNQIKLMQSVRATMTQPGADMQSPKPMPSPSKKSGSISGFISYIQSISTTQKLTKNDLLNQANTYEKDNNLNPGGITQRLRSSMPAQLNDLRNRSPIPQVLMQSLLQNMARYGANPNKHNVTSIISPMEKLKPNVMGPPKDSLTSSNQIPKPVPEQGKPKLEKQKLENSLAEPQKTQSDQNPKNPNRPKPNPLNTKPY